MCRRLLFDLQPLTTVAELKKLLEPAAETFQPVDVEARNLQLLSGSSSPSLQIHGS